MSAPINDETFEKIAIQQWYLSSEELQNCKQLQKQKGAYFGKSLANIALAEELLSTEDVKGIQEIATEQKLTFGGYEVKKTLGEGGLGVVYLAKQLSMHRYVALKVLYPKWVKDEEFRKRFLLEARIVGKLSHPNLIQVFDIGFDKGRYFFSMEYIAGSTIDKLIAQRDGPLPLVQSIDITMQVLDALNYIWEKKLVHRDIKPSNVIVTPQQIAKLGDFGFVKCGGTIERKLSSEDFVLGTPDYMSPEQAMGKEDLDYHSDIYSLGATLYHMATGSAPYNGSESMIIRQHIKAAIPSPRALNQTLPDGLCLIVEKMMAKSPHDRYQKYEDLKRDLLLVKEGSSPQISRLESGKSTIARVEDFVDHPLTRVYQLEVQLKALRRREMVYQIALMVLFTLVVVLMITLSYR